MFENWLLIPNNVVAWLIQGFSRNGPVPLVVGIFVVLVVLRPRIPRAVPLHHRRALAQMRWTHRLSIASALVALMAVPSVLQPMKHMGFMNEPLFNALFTSSSLIIGVLYLFPYLSSVYFWFPRPFGWYPDKSWEITPRFRIQAWLSVIFLWILNLAILVLQALWFLPENSSMTTYEILITAVHFAGNGMLFILLSAWLQYKISWRAPIPGVPLAIDMERRRNDLDSLQRISSVFLGAGVAKCMQYVAQIQFEIAPFWLASFSFIASWVISITSLILAMIPTWWLMRRRDPSQQLMYDIEKDVLDTKRSTDIFSVEEFQHCLPAGEDLTVRGSVHKSEKPYMLRILFSGSREKLTAPGTGSAPEEVAAAYTYMAKIAARCGYPLSDDEMDQLAAIRTSVRDLVEKRVALNEGVASTLVAESDSDSLQSGGQVPLGGDSSSSSPLDEELAALLGQNEAKVAIGLDRQIVEAWKNYEEEKEAAAQYQKQLAERQALEQSMWEAASTDLYAYDTYGYGYGYATNNEVYPYSADPYAGFGGYGVSGYEYQTDPWAIPGYQGYDYPDPYGTSLNPATQIPPDYGYDYGAAQMYGFDPAANFSSAQAGAAGYYPSNPAGYLGAAPTAIPQTSASIGGGYPVEPTGGYAEGAYPPDAYQAGGYGGATGYYPYPHYPENTAGGTVAGGNYPGYGYPPALPEDGYSMSPSPLPLGYAASSPDGSAAPVTPGNTPAPPLTEEPVDPSSVYPALGGYQYPQGNSERPA